MKRCFCLSIYLCNFVYAFAVIFFVVNTVSAGAAQQVIQVQQLQKIEKNNAVSMGAGSILLGSSIDTCYTIQDYEAYIPFLTVQDLVIFDFDNALFEPEMQDGVGSDQWFNKGLEYLRNEGLGGSNYFKVMLSIAFECRSHVKVRPVEGALTLEVVKRVQATGCRVMVLTSRSIVRQTFEQLKSIDIDFSKNAPSDKQLYMFLEKDSIAYKNGILFCGSNDKGLVLHTFLDMVNFHPKFISFFDDAYSNIVSVQRATHARNIPYKGFHYVYLEEKVKNYIFDPKSLYPYLERALTDPIESHPNLACLVGC